MSFDHYPIFITGNLALYSTAAAVIAAVLLDAWLGEPKRWHPLVGFGRMASYLELKLNKSGASLHLRLIGLLCWFLLLLPIAALSYFVSHTTDVYSATDWLVDVLLLYFSIGASSLFLHARQIYTPLSEHRLIDARHAVSMIVSRDTSQLNETEIATATVESVLENGNDAIFGAIFWFVLFGGTGAVIFRLANTLDAMWGYRTPRYLYFGWAAARLDDLLNLIPARLTALSYALCGHTASALQCWRDQASTWYSPNAGPVMATGAGAMQVKLGGAATYHGKLKQRPTLGLGQTASAVHIEHAISLVKRSLLLWCTLIIIGSIIRGLYLA